MNEFTDQEIEAVLEDMVTAGLIIEKINERGELVYVLAELADLN